MVENVVSGKRYRTIMVPVALQSESVPKFFDRMTDSVGSDHTAS